MDALDVRHDYKAESSFKQVLRRNRWHLALSLPFALLAVAHAYSLLTLSVPVAICLAVIYEWAEYPRRIQILDDSVRVIRRRGSKRIAFDRIGRVVVDGERVRLKRKRGRDLMARTELEVSYDFVVRLNLSLERYRRLAGA